MAAQFPEDSQLQFKFSSNFLMTALGLVGIGIILIALQIVSPWKSSHHVEHTSASVDAGHAGDMKLHEEHSDHMESAHDDDHAPAAHEEAEHGEEHHAAAEGHEAAEHGGSHHEPVNPRLFLSLHIALLTVLPLGLGGIFFVAFNHLSRSMWNVTVRRLAENYFWYLPFILILMLVVFFFGMEDVFHHWVLAPADDKLIAWKSPWLNTGFFITRNVLWVAVWMLFGFLFWKNSTAQDEDQKISHTKLNLKMGAAFLILFGLTFSATSWDLGMSLEPHWFSTMWGVYAFAGLALTTYSSMIIWIWYLKKAGYYGDSVNENHIHDLGKYMWGHTIFWAYIGFSQFMLIWYAHIPEETIFYHTRVFNNDMSNNAWNYVGITLVMLRFVLPFFLIIRRPAKRSIDWLAFVAAIHFVGQIVDQYWLAYPTLDHGNFVMFSWQEIGPLALMIGLFMLSVGWGLSQKKLIPVKDPRLEDCLHWHQ